MPYIPFKEAYSYEQRKREFVKITQSHPDKIPIIVEKIKGNSAQELDRHKFLVYRDVTVGQFMYVIRKRMKLRSDEALFLYIKNSLLCMTDSMSVVYKDHHDDDGFLYLNYAGENTFG